MTYKAYVNVTSVKHKAIGFKILAWCEQEFEVGDYKLKAKGERLFLAFKEDSQALMFKLVWSEYL